MIQDLHWDTLRERRARARVLLFHKIQQPNTVAIPMTWFVPSSAVSLTRGPEVKYILPHSRTNVYLHSFVPAVILLWNSPQMDGVGDIKDHEIFRSSLAAVKLCV